MKIPKKIKIGGIWYKINLVKMSNCGEATIVESKIDISKDMPQAQQEVTLFHEIIHVLNIQLDDVHIEFLAQGFYQVLKDNKLLRGG